MKPPGGPVFLARDSYRRRRMRDAARFLPWVGVFLVLLPLLWSGEGRTTSSFAFVFCVWMGLIVAAALVSRHLVLDPEDDAQSDDEDK